MGIPRPWRYPWMLSDGAVRGLDDVIKVEKMAEGLCKLGSVIPYCGLAHDMGSSTARQPATSDDGRAILCLMSSVLATQPVSASTKCVYILPNSLSVNDVAPPAEPSVPLPSYLASLRAHDSIKRCAIAVCRRPCRRSVPVRVHKTEERTNPRRESDLELFFGPVGRRVVRLVRRLAVNLFELLAGQTGLGLGPERLEHRGAGEEAGVCTQARWSVQVSTTRWSRTCLRARCRDRFGSSGPAPRHRSRPSSDSLLISPMMSLQRRVGKVNTTNQDTATVGSNL